MAYLLIFFSGAASLVYEVAWSRALSLIFGGSHLAVTTVLTVFMGGLAAGSALFGKRADAAARPLRLYGTLECGVAVFALVFMGLMRLYPSIYPAVARLVGEDRGALTAIRVVFAAIAMLPPALLMGGTLPALTRLMTVRSDAIGGSLSLLYGVNTAGAVVGSLVCGLVLLQTFGVDATLLLAIAVNVIVGGAALVAPARRYAGSPEGTPARPGAELAAATRGTSQPDAEAPVTWSARLVLIGTAVSGFCALGYEVLWTRMFTLVLGTSVYSFTIILVAFLTGIAVGSHAFAVAQRRLSGSGPLPVAFFGVMQVAIALAALAVTVAIADLPSIVVKLPQALLSEARVGNGVQNAATFLVAVAFTFVPAFLMGAAFPLAGSIVAAARRTVGRAVGETYAFNTTGSVLGAALTGYVLVPAIGIERSLQVLAVMNAGIGLVAIAAATPAKPLAGVAALASIGTAAAMLVFPSWGRVWDAKLLAAFQNNRRTSFAGAAGIRRMQGTEVLYSFEGVNETISVIRRHGVQSLIVNGRAEATTRPDDMQLQYALGHLPMLLHPTPRRVFVLGSGAGMALGATAQHPGVERIVLAEIEPGVLPATRTFGSYNHDVLDNPLVSVVLNDGRNFLMTTEQLFDVITADPIHPWSGGAAYLYTQEYFSQVAGRLAPGGIAAQWLPLYELSSADVRSVLGTFARAFPHVQVWVMFADAVLIGSRDPILIDEEALARRLSHRPIHEDLARIEMATVDDFLTYFTFGDEGARACTRGAVTNTDDNLFLEFSAPHSMGNPFLMAQNLADLAACRESVLGYLRPASDETARAEQIARARHLDAVGKLWDSAHSLLTSRGNDEQLAEAMGELMREAPDHAPLRLARRVR